MHTREVAPGVGQYPAGQPAPRPGRDRGNRKREVSGNSAPRPAAGRRRGLGHLNRGLRSEALTCRWGQPTHGQWHARLPVASRQRRGVPRGELPSPEEGHTRSQDREAPSAGPHPAASLSPDFPACPVGTRAPPGLGHTSRISKAPSTTHRHGAAQEAQPLLYEGWVRPGSPTWRGAQPRDRRTQRRPGLRGPIPPPLRRRSHGCAASEKVKEHQRQAASAPVPSVPGRDPREAVITGHGRAAGLPPASLPGGLTGPRETPVPPDSQTVLAGPWGPGGSPDKAFSIVIGASRHVAIGRWPSCDTGRGRNHEPHHFLPLPRLLLPPGLGAPEGARAPASPALLPKLPHRPVGRGDVPHGGDAQA